MLSAGWTPLRSSVGVGAWGASWLNPGPALTSGEHNKNHEASCQPTSPTVPGGRGLVAASSAVVRLRRRRVSGSGAPPADPGTGGRGVFILLDKVCRNFVPGWVRHVVPPRPPHYIVTDVTATWVDWRVDTP
nr:MAG TPA: hypothetical protein [Caudoviricetes sp.]